MKRQYNKAFINRDNLIITLKYLLKLQSKYKFENPRLNENVYNLHHLLSNLECDTKGRWCSTFTDHHGGMNKTYNDLRERYIHINYCDPCSLKHEIKEILLAGTDTVEVDISSTVVYIYSKFITHDDALLKAYKDGDFYSILFDLSREQQKKLTQIWLQGVYNETIQYNTLFTATNDFLKTNATKDNYKRNSGLFRDKEVKLLDDIIKDASVLFHLHDGFYIQKRNKKKLCDSIKKYYGDEVKYKTHDYSKDNLTESQIKSIIDDIEWKSKDITPKVEVIHSYDIQFNPRAKYDYIYTDTKQEVSAYVLQKLYNIKLNNIVNNNIMNGIETKSIYVIT